MKKAFVLSMALLLCVMSVFVGCSSKNELENYAKALQSELDKTPMEGFAVDCSVDGNSLVYTYKYDMEGLDLTEEVAKSTLDLLDSSSEAILTAVQAEVSSCESIFIRIADADGKVLAEKEYK